MKARLGTVQMSRGLPQGALESPVIFTGGPGQELESLTSDVEFGRLRARCDVRRRRCGSGSSVGCCSGSDGGRSGRKIEGSGSDSWHRENTLGQPHDGRKHCGGWLG